MMMVTMLMHLNLGQLERTHLHFNNSDKLLDNLHYIAHC